MSFTPIPISGLLDIVKTQKPSAENPIEQDGVTYRAPTRPNPPRQINVLSQAQLEEEFGTSLEIPDGNQISVSIDDSFVLDKPFKLGLGSSLKIFAPSAQTTLTYTGPGALFQNTNPANLMSDIRIDEILLTGDGTNKLFDLIGTGLFSNTTVQASFFADLGSINIPNMIFSESVFVGMTIGLKVINPFSIVMDTCLVVPTVPSTGLTFFSIIAGISTNVSIRNVNTTGAFGASESLFLIDPNALSTSFFVVERAVKTLGNLYQLGTDKPATAAAASGSDTQFDITAHDLKVGMIIVLKDFTTFSGYNGTFTVTAVNDANSVDIAVGFLGVDSTGTMSAKSLDSKDLVVDSQSNRDAPDSMFLAEARTTGTITVDSILNTLVPIQGITPVAGDFIADDGTERFTVDTSTGVTTYVGTQPITGLISFELNAEKASGGDQILNISLHINGTPQPKSDIPLIATAAPGSFGASARKIYTIQPGDEFQLFEDNTTNSTDTLFSKLVMVISKQ